MLSTTLLRTDRVSDGLLSALDRRDVALWIRDLPTELNTRGLAQFLGLPWKLVLAEALPLKALNELERDTTLADSMTRKRGFVQIIDVDPSRIQLPARCLPIYLLNGRGDHLGASDFASRLRRINMLEELRRSGVRDLFVISGTALIPPDLTELWASGFRCHLTFVSDSSDAERDVSAWLAPFGSGATLLNLSHARAIESFLARYAETFPEERHIVRLRDSQGAIHRIDLTEEDDPERPILDAYSLIEERHLVPVMREDLSEDDFIGFFRDSASSWLPYAAGVPWFRDQQPSRLLGGLLRRLDTVGPDENCIAYISSEPGAGGTTLARALAWEFAREGYPVLVAKQLPFAPDALPVANFLNRVKTLVTGRTTQEGEPGGPDGADSNDRRYEAPWIIVFDTVHWQHRDSELVQFRNELEKSGRPVCLLVVTGSMLGASFHNRSTFKRLTDLNHAIDLDEASHLGDHLNKFLRLYGKQRERWQWQRFYEDHTVQYLEGTAAFWVALSFWIQGQYDLSESIQEWMYRFFKQHATDSTLQSALLRVAAMSTERLSLPERLLPQTKGQWPMSYLLEEARPALAGLGLVRISADGEKYWALIHDILGRFLINAVFYDAPARQALGFGAVRDPDHMRFTLLRQVSHESLLGERSYRSLGEDFATSIFKIDPDRGRGSFAPFWQDVISALAEMPRSLRDTSRLFRHHVAISKRRIAKLDERLYNINRDEKFSLITSAIDDLKFALTHIEATPGSESNLNLFNSLARAYFDLADAEAERGATREKILEIRNLANEATRRAYDEDPTNSYAIETYLTNLLHTAKESPGQAVELCIEVLGIISTAITSNEAAYRSSQLSTLADNALSILLQQASQSARKGVPRTAIDVLVLAWQALAEGGHLAGLSLAQVPDSNRTRALEVLAHDAGRGNIQVLKLRYNLLCIGSPSAFKQQLELVEQIQGTNQKSPPQLRLEYAILLFQNGRPQEGDKMFRALRQAWRENEHFVEVPERLKWLRATDGKTIKTVKASVNSDYGMRAMARVMEFGNALVPFRPEEHGLRNPRVGTGFSCHVTFGHNGPFLRPVTAGAHA